MLDAAADLLLGSSCVGCGRAGRMLCGDCRRALPDRAAVTWPTPVPPGLVTPWAAGEYAGALRAMVVGHKDHGQWAFRRPLAGLLALAAGAAVARLPPQEPVVLVPVPSRPGASRRRGYDPTGALVRGAARRLRAGGRDARGASLLVSSAGVRDQAGLDAGDRAANLAGSMSCPGRGLRRLGKAVAAAHVVVCDDVLTTGATTREAQRALAAVGVPVVAVAAVAATRRRSGPGGGAIHREDSGAPLAPGAGRG